MEVNGNGDMESPDNLVILLQTNKGQLEIPLLSGEEPGSTELDSSFVTILQEGSDTGQLLYVTCLMDPAELGADPLAPDTLSADTLAPAGLGPNPEPHTALEPEPDPEPLQEINTALLTVNPGRALAQVHAGLRIEERLQVLEALLPPLEPRTPPNPTVRSQPIPCTVCGVAFSRPAQLRAHHLRRHSVNLQDAIAMAEPPDRPHACLHCPARFNRASQLGYHERRVHAGERAHCCQICRKAFFKRSDLSTHLRIHLGIQRSVCETCGRRFSHASNLIRHARVHTGVRPFPCSLCGRRFSQINAMLEHRAAHEPGASCICPVCNRSFRSQTTLRRHMRVVHPDTSLPSAAPQEPTGLRSRRFYCRVCGESFEMAALVRAHERTHEQDGGLRCRSCDQLCESLADLKTHSCRLVDSDTPDPDQLDPEPSAANPATLDPLKADIRLAPAESAPAPETLPGTDLVIYIAQEGWAQPAAVHVRALLDDATDCLQPANAAGSTSPASPTSASTPSGLSRLPSLAVPDSPTGPIEVKLPSLPTLNDSPAYTTAPLAPSGTNNALGLTNTNDPTDPASLDDATLLLNPSEALGLVQATSPTAAAGPTNVLVPERRISPVRTADQAEDDELDSSHKKMRVFKCPECPKRFRKNSNLKQHLGVHSVDQMRYCCSICSHPFAWKSTLNKHLLKAHGASNGAPLVGCELCSRSYRSVAQLQEHVRRDHQLERPHVCPVASCERRFYKKYDLKVHLRTHTQERPYVCGWCGKSFYHQSHIIRHERIHSGQRPYSCEDCGRCFNQSSSLKTHRRRHQNAGPSSVMLLLPVSTQ